MASEIVTLPPEKADKLLLSGDEVATDGRLVLEIDRRETGGVLDRLRSGIRMRTVDVHNSGVWQLMELVAPNLIRPENMVGGNEGNTWLYHSEKVEQLAGINGGWLRMKHEGENPSGSFKDRGMVVAISHAKQIGAQAVCCASTGNTSASMAKYARMAGLTPIVFLPADKVAAGKLVKAIGFGATIVPINGSFDDAMKLVPQFEGIYPCNSYNPYRLVGQMTIGLEILRDFRFQDDDIPDWIALPAGNLGNTAALGMALELAKEVGLIKKVPRILSVQAEGASPFAKWFKAQFVDGKYQPEMNPETIATAIRIGNPVSLLKALMAILFSNGYVTSVTDEEILAVKEVIDDEGIGCEPASAASVAGVKQMIDAGVILPHEKVVCILTGNMGNDPDAVMKRWGGDLTAVEPNYDAIMTRIGR